MSADPSPVAGPDAPSANDAVIATIGYEKASFADVAGALQAAGVATVIDVRDRPQSRRAGFSKRQLAASLAETGVGYVHLRALGTPKEGRLAAQRGDMALFWQIVDRQLATPAAEAELEQAAATAQAGQSCLLCYEADHRHCHRARIAELLERRFGFRTHHLAAAPGIF